MAGGAALRIVVAGGGAIGSSVALALVRAGARVTLADPAPLGANASGVAAGMLAPVFETLLDAAAPPLTLMRAGLAMWPDLAASIGLSLDRTGAMAVGGAGQLEAWQDRLLDLGLQTIRLSPDAARARCPALAPDLGGLLTSEDVRLEAADALAALRAAFEAAGGRLARHALAGFEPGAAHLADGAVIAAEAVVLATGASTSLAHLAPALRRLTPIKGHILRAAGLAMSGPVLRLTGGYVCPSPAGALIGASMEVGRADDAIDPAAVDALRQIAARAIPALADTAVTAATGVRAAAPDGLPMVGPAGAPGVWLAAGARRDGWLLAPLIADVLRAAIVGDAPHPWAASLDPGRFD
jgi:glycine oxidase